MGGKCLRVEVRLGPWKVLHFCKQWCLQKAGPDILQGFSYAMPAHTWAGLFLLGEGGARSGGGSIVQRTAVLLGISLLTLCPLPFPLFPPEKENSVG